MFQVVVSDHGMTDNGNHGGSSYEETDSVALFVGLQPNPTDFKLQAYRTINQVKIYVSCITTVANRVPFAMTCSFLGCLSWICWGLFSN